VTAFGGVEKHPACGSFLKIYYPIMEILSAAFKKLYHIPLASYQSTILMAALMSVHKIANQNHRKKAVVPAG
jgi:hypothetical protein